MYYKMNDIDEFYTDIVSAYLQNGFKFYSPSMAGHQGEVCRIDLIKDNEFYRIHIEREPFFDDYENYCNKLVIYISKGNCTFYKWNEETVWNNELKNIDNFTYYQIGRKDFYTDDFEEIKRIKKLRNERYNLRKTSYKIFTDEKYIDLAIKVCKKTKGYKTVKKQNISGIIKRNNKYYVVVKYKNNILIK